MALLFRGGQLLSQRSSFGRPVRHLAALATGDDGEWYLAIKYFVHSSEIQAPTLRPTPILLFVLLPPVSKLGAQDVAVKMAASPIGAAEMSGAGVVMATGSGVKGLSVDDLVVAKAPLGAFREVAKVPAASLAKVPSTVPVEYAGVLGAPCTAAKLLEGVAAGSVVVQSGAETLVGQAVVQIAKAKGIRVVSIVSTNPDEEEVVDLLKAIGGAADIVVPDHYAVSWRFKALLSDVPAPSLAIHYAAPLEDESLAGAAEGKGATISSLKTVVEKASPEDLTKLKITSMLKSMAGKSVTYGAGVEGTVAEEAAVDEVSAMISQNQLALWLESYPTEDFDYVSKKAEGAFPGYRALVLKF
jgi:NADPH:quinone reductase-like Zn-dependent oxidoreductase